jgi:hypothetical protein
MSLLEEQKMFVDAILNAIEAAEVLEYDKTRIESIFVLRSVFERVGWYINAAIRERDKR